jgi:hypothetical protein
MARAIQPGKMALIAEVTEPTTEVVRRTVDEVEAELAAAEEAPEPLRRKRGGSSGRIDELKAKFGSS